MKPLKPTKRLKRILGNVWNVEYITIQQMAERINAETATSKKCTLTKQRGEIQGGLAMSELTLTEKLIEAQVSLKAPKNKKNKFGNYNYRSAEDILEELKPILAELGLLMTINDEIVRIENRYYVKAIVTITDGDNQTFVEAYAREQDNKKGMDQAQITGAASSYARKYALNGMFAIDDTKDSDATNKHGKDKKNNKKSKKPIIQKYILLSPTFMYCLLTFNHSIVILYLCTDVVPHGATLPSLLSK